MSQRNVETLRNLFRGVEERDLGAYLAACDRGVVVRKPGSLSYGGEYRGPEGVRWRVAAWMRTWSALELGDERKLGAAFIDAGDNVVVCWRLRARTSNRGGTLDMPMVSLCRMRDGKVVEA